MSADFAVAIAFGATHVRLAARYSGGVEKFERFCDDPELALIV